MRVPQPDWEKNDERSGFAAISFAADGVGRALLVEDRETRASGEISLSMMNAAAPEGDVRRGRLARRNELGNAGQRNKHPNGLIVRQLHAPNVPPPHVRDVPQQLLAHCGDNAAPSFGLGHDGSLRVRDAVEDSVESVRVRRQRILEAVECFFGFEWQVDVGQEERGGDTTLGVNAEAEGDGVAINDGQFIAVSSDGNNAPKIVNLGQASPVTRSACGERQECDRVEKGTHFLVPHG